MNSFEKKILEHQQLQKSSVETFTGRNDLFDVVETLRKAGVPEDEMLEKAKYIRREGTKGNYKYIYEEPKENRIKTDKVGGDKDQATKNDEKRLSSIRNQIEGLKDSGSLDDDGEKRLNDLQKEHKEITGKEYKEKDSTQNKEDKKLSVDNIYEAFKDKFGNNENLEIRKPEKDNYSGSTQFFVRREEYVSGLGRKAMNVYGIESRKGEFNIIYDGVRYDLDVTSVEEAVDKLADKMKLQKSQSSDLQKAEHTEAQQKKIAKVMGEFKDGTLKSSSGEKVTSKDQALAIAMSEAGVSKSELVDIIKSQSNK